MAAPASTGAARDADAEAGGAATAAAVSFFSDIASSDSESVQQDEGEKPETTYRGWCGSIRWRQCHGSRVCRWTAIRTFYG
eukprot:SAG22_NODE_455_length_10287_cov_1276.978406_7_plen_81_part_00